MSEGCGALLTSVVVMVSSWVGGTGHDNLVMKRFADAGEVLGQGVSSLVFLGLTGGAAAFSVLGVRVMDILSRGYSLMVVVREALFFWGYAWGISWGFVLGRF